MLKILNPPLDTILVNNLDTLWRSAFGKDFVTDVPRSLLTENAPLPHTVDVYTKVIEKRFVSGAVAIAGGSFPKLGGLGEVSTVPEFRGSGFEQRFVVKFCITFLTHQERRFIWGPQILLLRGYIRNLAGNIFQRLNLWLTLVKTILIGNL